jgi:acetyl esterase/lipase
MLTRTWAAWLIVAIGSVTSAQVRPDDLLKEEVPAATRRVPYGPDALQFAELRLPKTTGPYPTVILIHGGCWVDRLPGQDPRITTFELLRPLAAALTAADFATWNIEYRRAGSPGGGWPTTFLDVGSATDYIREIAPSYNLDLHQVLVAGHSSGGQLALWTAARSRLPDSSPLFAKTPLHLKAAVDIDGPPDLASAHPSERKFCPVAGISQLLGGSPAERPERYRDSSALAFLPLGIPQKIVAGGLLKHFGELVGNYQAQAKAKGDAVAVLTLEGQNHFEMLVPGSRQGKTLIDVISSLRK